MRRKLLSDHLLLIHIGMRLINAVTKNRPTDNDTQDLSRGDSRSDQVARQRHPLVVSYGYMGAWVRRRVRRRPCQMAYSFPNPFGVALSNRQGRGEMCSALCFEYLGPTMHIEPFGPDRHPPPINNTCDLSEGRLAHSPSPRCMVYPLPESMWWHAVRTRPDTHRPSRRASTSEAS